MNLDWMIDPMEMPGPQFLAFYAAVAASLTVLTWWLRHKYEGGPAPRLPNADPYQIAFLRGGADEVLRVALFQLLDREALAVKDGRIGPGPKADEPARDDIEADVLAHFSIAAEPKTLFDGGRSSRLCGRYEPELVRLGLLPGPEDRRRRWRIGVPVAMLLTGLAIAKFSIGISRDRPVLFLAGLGVFAPIVALAPLFQRRTARGTALVKDLKEIFAGARETGLARGASDAPLAVAVFGLACLPESVWPWRKEVFPKAGGGSSCGGGCSGGCGGGGCGGGGCGGCGGD
jgi:uncharacterized protein (TIGR04222 family)